ncbi:MAG: type I-B CRISPR-associated endonuclease Cas1 [Methanomicrobia archaeon]|nr:type I-B CRISPR-associated endonuclease Cas1 [Methanomicrobia archaeon]
MKVNYYILRNGVLRRKQNTVYFVYKKNAESKEEEEEKVFEAEVEGTEAELKIEAEEQEGAKAKPGIEKKILPIERISAIYAYGRISFTSGVISYLSKYGTPVHFYNYYGFYEGSYYPRERLLSGDLVINQARHFIEKKKRLELAKAFVQGAAENIMRNLEYYNREGRAVTKQLEEIQALSTRIDSKETNTVQRLMALEGAIRNTYYQSYDKIVPSGFKFGVRTKQPPENPLNALISFGNSLLYGTVLTEIYNTQLNPTISYLHEPSERRFSLSLDIAEVFKPFLVDRVIFKLVNKHMLSEGDFVQELNSCLLNDKGRRTFLAEWDEKLKTTIKHRDLKRNVSYQRLIRLECYKLTKHLLGTKPYKPFVIWW